MSVNMNSGAAAVSAKHRGNAEGSVRVLGQTAAVAGISGALLLALKAMVLVSPAVLPGGDGLDALGRPNAVTAPAVPAPVVFEPASADMPIGASERTAPSITRTVVTIPDAAVAKPGVAGVVIKPNNPTKPSTPSTPSTPSNPGQTPGTVGGVTKPVTDLLDGVVPGVGGTVGGVVDTVDKVAKPVTDTVKTLPVVGGVVETVEETVAGEQGVVKDVTDTVGSTVGSVTGGVTGGTTGGLLGGLTGKTGLLK